MRRPVGPLPTAVYWRRRVVVIGVPLVLIGALVYSCTAGNGNGSSPVAKGSTPAPHDPTTSPQTPITETPGPTTSVVPGDGGVAAPTTTAATTAPTSGAGSGATSSGAAALSGCALRLQVSTDQNSYGSTAQPHMTVTAVNMGSANCTLDVGGKGLVVTVLTSTGGVVWSTADCPATTDERALSSGDIYTENVQWDRHSSVPNRCENGEPTVSAGYYAVQVSANGLTSTRVPFELAG